MKLVSHRTSVTLPSGTTFTTLHLTPEAKAGLSTNGVEIPADAQPSMAEAHRLQVDVPAQERTRRAVQRTIRLSITTVATAVFIALACFKPEAAWPLAVMIGMLDVQALVSEYCNREDL